MGPGAGSRGGRVVAAGHAGGSRPSWKRRSPAAICPGGSRFRCRPSAAGRPRRASLQLTGATAHNLQNVDVEIPLGLLVCVTGVSGSGKSSLVVETLARALARRLNGAEARPAPHQGLRGVSQLDRLVEVDQSPIGRTPRSNRPRTPACWTTSAACSPAPSRPGSAATASAGSASTPRAAAARSAKGRACGGSR